MQPRSTIKTQFKCHHSQRHFLFRPNKVKCFFSTYDPDSFTVKAILHWIIISSYPPIGYKLRAGSAVYMCVCVCAHECIYIFSNWKKPLLSDKLYSVCKLNLRESMS